jgi:hypothetical protein
VWGWLLIGLAVVAAGFVAGCQAPTRGSLGCYLELNSCDSTELVAYRSTFRRDRADVLSAVRSWSGCLPDAVACRQALNRIEAATTGFGELSVIRRPGCVDEADRHLGAAIGDFRNGDVDWIRRLRPQPAHTHSVCGRAYCSSNETTGPGIGGARQGSLLAQRGRAIGAGLGFPSLPSVRRGAGC